ncbi:uncharacterized protein J4E84_010094 [Alternaria hordeiaustralica]|uniref:uncharacterized protein n=1 Tax=Alternaria hordeiaustralica TaxID=1187925 RepID=UPI0020C2A60B|nr:uncharacterized protein J4E84_010094 [Alternaria hordeiaustralica]KAI4675352.1 hypothetical protein J4E84_010094 [Alternaria hordeiaustralica]
MLRAQPVKASCLVATAKECPLCFWILRWLGSFDDESKKEAAETGYVLATLYNGEFDHEELDCDGNLVEEFDTLRLDIELWPNESTDYAAIFRIVLRALAKELTMNIDANTLPPVFKDAIDISRSLEVPYLWIDALCIVQNDAEDWDKEAALMGQVYSNAFCNLGASAAAEKSAQRKEFKRTYGSYLKRDSSMTARVLLRRGWVLQERLLSPRSIYYDDKLHWECSELHACETFPQGAPNAGGFNPWGKDGFPFRAANLLYDEMKYKKFGIYSPQKCPPDVAQIREVYRKWLHVVENFSNCQLTYEEDRFPALMGLAKYWQATTKDHYVAGMWRRDLVYGLLWSQKYPTHKKPLPRDYRVKLLYGTHEILRLSGLILERVAGKKVFKRIGMFEHGWFQHRLSNGEWPLFIDWDPLREKKTTLTII